jgi:hypothetical protein
MNGKRILVLAMTTTLGVLALANPASAGTAASDVAWAQKTDIASVDLDSGGAVDGRDFLVWQRH